MVVLGDTVGTALLIVSVGVLLAGLGIFFIGFAQFAKFDGEKHGGLFHRK